MKFIERLKPTKIWHFTLVFFLVAVVIISRRPDAILNPQFFAEDGFLWFADAYNLAWWEPFFLSAAGYLQTLSRVVATISLLFPIKQAPLVFNLVAVVIQALPVLFLLSPRFGSYKFAPRFLVAVVYLLLGNTSEIYLNITSGQWYLALLAVMVVLADEPKSRVKWWRFFDYGVLLLSGLSGPFSIFLLPVIGMRWLILRTRWGRENQFNRESLDLTQLSIISSTAMIQVGSLLMSGVGTRSHLWSELRLLDIYQIYYRQVVWGLLVGPHGFTWLQAKLPFSQVFFAGTTFLSLVVVGYSLVKADLKLRLFLLYAGVVLAAGVFMPTVTDVAGKTPWEVLFEAHGIRYWLMPMLAFLSVLVWSLKAKYLAVRGIAVFFLVFLALFTLKNYRRWQIYTYPALENLGYQAKIDDFQVKLEGTEVVIPINPRGWQMKLVKR